MAVPEAKNVDEVDIFAILEHEISTHDLSASDDPSGTTSTLLKSLFNGWYMLEP